MDKHFRTQVHLGSCRKIANLNATRFQVLFTSTAAHLPVIHSVWRQSTVVDCWLDKRHQPTRYYYLMQVQLHNSSKYLCTHVGTLLCNLLRDQLHCRACRWFSEEQIGSTYSCCTGDLINLPPLYIIMPGECQWCRTESVNIIVPVDLWLAFMLTTEEDQGRDRQAQQLSGILFCSYQALSSLFSLSVGGPQRNRRRSGSRSRLVADSRHSSWSPQLALYILIALLLH